jgi:NitT/TauT family transport system ATP-binding protein
MTAASPPRIEYSRVTKRFGADSKTVTAVENISLSIRAGEVVSLIGPSGCGKSTLLNMGSGLYQASAGEVRVDGELVTGPNDQVAFMLQKDLLLPWRTIRQNVEYGLEIKGVPAATRHERSLKLMERVHLSGFENHYPHQLSGGMRQRAAIARTLAIDPAVLLMDEPFSALDAQTKIVLQQDLAEMLARERRTALLITHDLTEAILLSDRIAVMSRRPGRIIEEIVVEIPDRPNPLARRRHPAVNGYIDRLMELLHVGDREPASAAMHA